MQTRSIAPATLFPLILTGLLVALSFWLEVASRPPDGANDGKSRHDPDYYVENFDVRRFGPDGKMQHTIVAKRMQHYPDDESTEVDAPHITYHRTPPTFISSKTAHLDKDGKHVILMDDVRIRRSGIAGKPETVLTTQRMDAFPDDETAFSNVPVTIRQGFTTIDGNTFSIDNKIQTTILEGQVRGIIYRNGGVKPAAVVAIPPVVQTIAPKLSVPAAKPKAAAKPKPAAKAKPRSQPKPKPKR